MSTVSQALVDRLAAEHPRVQVHELAAGVREDHDRTPFANPNGVLVSRVRKASIEAGRAAESRAVTDRAELERYAEAQFQLYRLCSMRSLSPELIADCLQDLLGNGFTKLNTLVIQKLREAGSRWPDFPPLPPM